MLGSFARDLRLFCGGEALLIPTERNVNVELFCAKMYVSAARGGKGSFARDVGLFCGEYRVLLQDANRQDRATTWRF